MSRPQRVRVVARADEGVVVIYPSPRDPKENPNMSDEEWYDYAVEETLKTFQDEELFKHLFVDMDSKDLPPLATRAKWRIVDGKVVDAPRSDPSN